MIKNDMLDFLKAITEADRLRIIGLLAHRPHRFSEIHEIMGFHPADTKRHLDVLLQSGMVCLDDESYTLNEEALESLARQQLQGEREYYAAEPGQAGARQRVLAAHLKPDGTIKTIPAQPAKLRIILEYLISAFATGANYSEKEVNLILAHFHADTSALRRYLVDAGMLARERNGSRYWRPS